MCSTELSGPDSEVRSAVLEFQHIVEATPDAAAVMSAFLPDSEKCVGFVKGDIEGLTIVVLDAIGRMRELLLLDNPKELVDGIMRKLVETVINPTNAQPDLHRIK